MEQLRRVLVKALEEQGLVATVPWNTPTTIVLIIKDRQGGGGVAAKVWTASRLLEGGNMMQPQAEHNAARILSHHPGFIVPLAVEISTTRGLLVVSPYGGLNLQDMQSYLLAHGRLPADPATTRLDIGHHICVWLAQLCLSLEHMHRQGQVHRDVKLTNVLVSEDGNLRLADFGLAAYKGDRCFAGDGTYVVPELAVRMADGRRRRDDPDAVATYTTGAVDMWAVGVLAYELVTGSRPDELNYAAYQVAGQAVGLTSEAAEELRLDHASQLDWAPHLARMAGMAPGLAGVADFAGRLLVADPEARMTAAEALVHPCISAVVPAERAARHAMSLPGSAWQQQRARDVQLAGKVQRAVLRCQALLASQEDVQAGLQEESQLRQCEAALQQQLQGGQQALQQQQWQKHAMQQELQQQQAQQQALQQVLRQVRAQQQEVAVDVEALNVHVAEERAVLQGQQAAAEQAKAAAIVSLAEEQQQLAITEQEAAAAQRRLQELRQEQAVAERVRQEAVAAAAIAEAQQHEQEQQQQQQQEQQDEAVQMRPASPQEDDAQAPAAAEQAAGAAGPGTVAAQDGLTGAAAGNAQQQADTDVQEPDTPSRASEGAGLTALLSGSEDDAAGSGSDDDGAGSDATGSPSRACVQGGRRQRAWWRRAAIVATHAISFLGATLDVQPVRRAGVPSWAA